MLKEEVVKSLIQTGAVAVIRLSDASKLIKVSEAINKGGISANHSRSYGPSSFYNQCL